MIFTPPAALTPKLPEIPDPPLYSMSAMVDIRLRNHGTPTFVVSPENRSVYRTKGSSSVSSKSLAQGMGWEVNRGSEFDKAVCVFALNTVSPLSSPFKSGARTRES